MNRTIHVLVFLTVLLSLSACDIEQGIDMIAQPSAATAEQAAARLPTSTVRPLALASATRASRVMVTITSTPPPSKTPSPTTIPTATNTSTSTATARPTSTPTPTFTPSPTSTPTPPSPAAILGLANFQREAAASYHFELVRETQNNAGETDTMTLKADYQQPHAVSGRQTEVRGKEIDHSSIVAFDKQYYEMVPRSRQWTFSPAVSGEAATADLAYLWQKPFLPQDYKALALDGISERDDRHLYLISGLLPGELLAPYGIEVAGDILVEHRIGVEDGRYQYSSLIYNTVDPQTGDRLRVNEHISFSEYDEAVEIDIPDVLFDFQEAADDRLGIRFLLPADWTVEASGETGCTGGSCLGIRLSRQRPGGAHSAITLTALRPASQAFMEKSMEKPDYEDSQVGLFPARLREGTTSLDGLIYLQPDQALQLSAQWQDHPEEEVVVQYIVDSIKPVTTAPPEGFQTVDLPGWATLALPEDWHFMASDLPGTLMISSKEADDIADLDEDDALLNIYEGFIEDLPAVDIIIEELLPLMPDEWRMVGEPEPLTINGQEAATVTHRDEYGFTEQLTLIKAKDASRSLVIHANAMESSLSDYEPIFETVRSSAQLYARGDAPEVWPYAAFPEDYTFFADTEEGYYLGYPLTWQLAEEDEVIVLVPGDREAPTAAEFQLGSVYIYPPSSPLGDPEPTEEWLTASARMDALWQWAGSPTISETMLVSDPNSFRLSGHDHTASFFVARDTSVGEEPIYGFLGLVTDGFSTVKMVAWFDDPYTYRQEWQDIFNSISVTAAADLDRESATPLTAGQMQTGTMSSDKPQLFSFNAGSGERFALLSRIYTPEEDGKRDDFDLMEIALYDPQNQSIGYSGMVSPLESELLLFMAESTGEHVLSVSPFVTESPATFNLQLLPIAEGEPGVIGIKQGDLYDDCQEYGFADLESQKIAIIAQPLGYYHYEVGLHLKVFDGSRQLLWEEVAYNIEEDQHENYEVELVGDWQIYNYAGLPIAADLATPEDGRLIVQICEPGLHPVDFELIILALPE